MSEIVIRGIEFPKEGTLTLVITPSGEVYRIPRKYYRNDTVVITESKAVELPPHGRLIDADAFKKYCETGLELINRELHGDALKMATAVTESFCKDIDEAPTVVESEE